MIILHPHHITLRFMAKSPMFVDSPMKYDDSRCRPRMAEFPEYRWLCYIHHIPHDMPHDILKSPSKSH